MHLFESICLAALLSLSGAGIPSKEEKFSLSAFLRERNDLVFSKAVDVSYGKVYQFHQEYRGTEVYGASCTVSTDKEGHILSKNDCTSKISSLSKKRVSQGAAEKRALSFGGKVLGCREVIDPQTGHLCYDFSSTAQGGADILISSYSGEPLCIAPKSSFVTVPIKQTNIDGEEVELPIEREEEDGREIYYLSDEVKNIYCYDAKGSKVSGDLYVSDTGVFEDSMAVTVYQTILKSYAFYEDEKNVGVSWKGIGGNNDDIEENYDTAGEVPLLVLVHYGQNYENANCGYDWEHGVAQMLVGDGRENGILYRQGRAVDIIAHEYQHAVTDLLSPSGLLYLNESGAINECVSDIFGSLVEGHELSDERFWSIGEDGVPASRGDVIRSMKQPSGGNVMHMKDEAELCTKLHDHEDAQCDYGSTHENSTILSHAQYRMWQKMPEFFTRERIGELWFSTVATLSYQCDFEGFARQMMQAAENLGYGEEQIALIEETFFESGILKEKNTKTHVVTFMDEKNKVEMITVRDGEKPYIPVLSDREVPAGRFAFMGWDKDLSAVTEDIVTVAIFDIEYNKYTVNFSVDGKIVFSVEVEYGQSAPPPKETPTKAKNEREEFVFDRWDTSLDNVTSDRTITAVFRSVLRKYDVVFMSEGAEIARTQVEYGKGAKAPETPLTKASDERYDYIFDKWVGDFDHITEDTTVTAKFKEQLRKYSVKFMDKDRQLAEGYWHFGEEVPLTPPEEEGKSFDGWYLDRALTRRAESVKIEGDVVLYAKWKEEMSMLPLILGAAGGAVVLAAGAAAILIVRRKKRKS